MTQHPPPQHRHKTFRILRAAQDGGRFVAAHARALGYMAALPVAVQWLTVWAVVTWRPDASAFERYLWSLPANSLIAWFFFATARMAILGESFHALPPDENRRAHRERCMKAAILLALLFMAGVAVFSGAFAALSGTMQGADGGEKSTVSAFSWTVFLLTGAALWGLRFSVIHIPAAVGAPLRPFLRAVDGAGFSLRLVGLGLVTMLPVFVLSQFLVALLLPAQIEDVTPEQLRTIALAGQPLSVLWMFLYNIAAAFGLKRMFGWGEKT